MWTHTHTHRSVGLMSLVLLLQQEVVLSVWMNRSCDFTEAERSCQEELVCLFVSCLYLLFSTQGRRNEICLHLFKRTFLSHTTFKAASRRVTPVFTKPGLEGLRAPLVTPQGLNLHCTFWKRTNSTDSLAFCLGITSRVLSDFSYAALFRVHIDFFCGSTDYLILKSPSL